jgi:CheY-like chemotaxis protein
MKTFSTQALAPLIDMQTQLLSVQTTHQTFQHLLAKGDAFRKEDVKPLVIANADEVHEAQAIASGMNGFVAKPFTQAAINEWIY